MKQSRFQGSRLTFQLASPVASDRFDPVAKTNFSLARHLNIHCRIKSSIMQHGPWILKKSPSKPRNWCRRKTFFSFKLPIHDFGLQNNLFGQLGRVPFDLKFRFEFPPGRTDLVIFPLEPISHQELLDKMLKDRDEVAVLGAVSCFL